jgi:hypothetical protein
MTVIGDSLLLLQASQEITGILICPLEYPTSHLTITHQQSVRNTYVTPVVGIFSVALDNAEFNRAFIRKPNRTPFFLSEQLGIIRGFEGTSKADQVFTQKGFKIGQELLLTRCRFHKSFACMEGGGLNFREAKTELGSDSRIFRSSIQMLGGVLV